MKIVVRSAAALTAALAVLMTVSPTTDAPAPTATGWCMRIGPGTNGPCPIGPPPGQI